MPHESPDPLWLWLNDQQTGPIAAQDLNGQTEHGEITRETLYFEPSVSNWRPLAEYPREVNQERLEYIKGCGIGYVKFSNAGRNDECETCRELGDRVFPIAEAPSIPPPGCTCFPWCKAAYVAVREP